MFSLVSLPTGDSVVVVGYGGLGRSCGPSLTCGVLSKAISLNDQPVMLQTTCAVQAGASGGAVVRTHSGELLGKEPCNYKMHVLFLISGGHMMTTENFTVTMHHMCREKAATVYTSDCFLCKDYLLFCRYRVQQHKGLGCQCDLPAPQL